MDSLATHELQIILSTLQRTENRISFIDCSYGVNDSLYSYPANTVKLPIALLTLEKLETDNRFSLTTPFFIEGDSTTTSFNQELKRLFETNNHHSFNSLFEYLGSDTINIKLTRKNTGTVSITRRLGIENADDIATRPLIYYVNDSVLKTTRSFLNQQPKRLYLKNILKGNAYYQGLIRVDLPMDFSAENYLPLTTLHNLMKRLISPGSYTTQEQFMISEEHRNFLIRLLMHSPSISGDTVKASAKESFLFPSYFKRKHPNVTVINVCGKGYGYLTDTAYIYDPEHRIEFILSATIYVNKNGVFNDEFYEYTETGIPFLSQIGREIYKQHLTR